MLNHEYETVIIVRPDIEEAATLALVAKMEAVITENQGRVLLRDDWGQRKLAYAIGKHQKGFYSLLNYTAPADLVEELERKIRIEDNIIRFLTVKIAEMVDVELRERQAADQRRQRAEEQARARAEAEARAAQGGYDGDDSDNDDDDEDEDEDADSEPA